MPPVASVLDRRGWSWFFGIGVLLMLVPVLNALPVGSPFALSDYLVPLFGKFACGCDAGEGAGHAQLDFVIGHAQDGIAGRAFLAAMLENLPADDSRG